VFHDGNGVAGSPFRGNPEYPASINTLGSRLENEINKLENVLPDQSGVDHDAPMDTHSFADIAGSAGICAR
jgi:hypothetical protein